MKILQVIPVLTKGGAEKVVVDLSNSQELLGHSVELLCAYPNIIDSRSSELNKNIKITYLANSRISNFSMYTKMYFWIRANSSKLSDFEVIHTHLTFGLIFGAFVNIFLMNKKEKRPVLVFTCHLVGMNVSRSKLNFHRALSRFFDHFVLMGRNKYWNNAAASRSFYSFIPNGVNALKRLENLKSSSIQIGTLSRLVTERKPALLVDSFAEILKSLPSAQFTIGGEGPELDGLLKQVDKLKMSNFVTFVGKVDDVSNFYSKLNFYITLNVGSITGISGLEAVSAGIPTLAIQLDQYYLGGEEDWIASFASYSKLTNFLRHLYEDENMLANYISRQYRVFNQNFTCKKMTENYLKIYTKPL
jgi:glycosyltransferase involved in cell wall biosynthesis